MTPPRVGIIMRTRNRPVLLARALASVASQTAADDCTLVVVNDAGRRAVVEAAVEPHRAAFGDRLAVLHREQSTGMEAATNAGLQKLPASVRWVCIHDDDDSWHPDFVQTCQSLLDSVDGQAFAGVVTRTTRVVETIGEAGQPREIDRHPFNPWLQHPVDLQRMLQENVFPPISFMFAKSTLDEVGPFDESLPVLGDWEFNLRLLLRHDIAVIKRELAFYHHRTASGSSQANSVQAGDALHKQVDARLRQRWAEHPSDPAWRAIGRAAIAGRQLLDDERRADRLHWLITRLKCRLPEDSTI